MNVALLCAALLSAFALGEAIECSQLTKVPHDASKTLAPFGDKWVIAYSNVPQMDQCVNFEYRGYRNMKKEQATALFINSMGHLAYRVRVNKAMNQWRAKADQGPEMKFRKLEINYLAEYFMIYTCDKRGRYIDQFRTFTTNTKGVDMIQARLEELKKNNSLPFRNNVYPVKVWNATLCPKIMLSNAPLKLGPLDASLPANLGTQDDDSDIDVDGKSDRPTFPFLPDWLRFPWVVGK